MLNAKTNIKTQNQNKLQKIPSCDAQGLFSQWVTNYWKLPCMLPPLFSRNNQRDCMFIVSDTCDGKDLHLHNDIVHCLVCFSSASNFNFPTHNWTFPLNVSQIKVWEADQDFTRANDTLVYIGSPLEAYITDLSPGKSYMLRVLAFSRGGDGKKSSPPWKFQLGE